MLTIPPHSRVEGFFEGYEALRGAFARGKSMKAKIIAALAAASFISACTTDPYTGDPKLSNTAGGALIGAGVGALAGLAVGGSPRAQRNAVLIGAGIGALGGGAIGAYMDQQEAELRGALRGTGVGVVRNGDNIQLIMPSNITFATDQDQVMPAFYPTLNSVALVLKKYNRTLVDVNGHTDSTGDDNYNFQLSERRALSVANYLGSKGNDPRRFSVLGFGERQPIASNATEAGRAQNRRVEIELAPISG
jgi:outer membrane protein OmpA-like peptidoglycan-associated protein